MYCALRARLPVCKTPAGISMAPLRDLSIFKREPHPYFGPVTTAIRRFELERQQVLVAREPRTCWNLMAHAEGKPLGICTLFRSGAVAGFFDVGVLDRARNRGIGSALMSYACRFARDLGCEAAVLISSGMGYSMYQRAGFREVARIGYWYTASP
jgi:GNAT superfamily N-acetyltransferase